MRLIYRSPSAWLGHIGPLSTKPDCGNIVGIKNETYAVDSHVGTDQIIMFISVIDYDDVGSGTSGSTVMGGGGI